MSSINIDTHELVSSKENIQPLRRGRDTTILCAALQAETDADVQQELEKQRNEFEIRLRSSNSDDPLSDWCAYIHWIEQSFPRQAREGKLNVVLRKCINKFKDIEEYMNDVRFVKLCIKYADIEENTVELLSQMHRHGIGVSCAELYITWAEKYAIDNCFKKANAIYERGLQCSAQPIELLQEAYQNFQAFLVRKMMNDGETFQPTVLDSNPVETRQPYNILQSVTAGQKKLAPNIRIGQNVIGAAGKLQQISNKDQKPKSNKMIKIFEDNDSSCLLTEPKAKIEKLQSKKVMTKENSIKPGPWTNKQNKNVPFAVESSVPVPFQVHRDVDEESVDRKHRAVPSSVLKTHKAKTDYEDENFANAPLFYPEPYDPTRVPMYCKEQVYAGGLEFQFEELHAIKYRKKREKFLSKGFLAQKPVAPETPEGSSEVQTPSTLKGDSEATGDIERGKSIESADKRKNGSLECRRKTLFTNSLAVSEPPKNTYAPEENLPGTDYSMNQTIHTKEALSEMQQLWFSKPPSPVPLIAKPAKPAGKSILKPSKPCFSLYVDESCLENLKTSEQPEKPLDLTLKSAEREEPPGGVKRKTGLPAKIKHVPENCKENFFNQENVDPVKKVTTESEADDGDDDKENGVPEGYCGPVGRSNRKVSGILTPAENVEIAPLSDEEVEEDEDEGEGQNYSSIIQCNNTEITETWNFTKGFQFPRGESTPNFRKSFRNKEECNESVFVSEQCEDKKGKDKTNENEEKLQGINDRTIVLHSGSKKSTASEGENFIKNLSVIAESSREYRSSSSGSSGASTLPLRPSRNFPYTPSEGRSLKLSLTTSQTTLHKTKGQSYMGYEASSEFSQTALKTPTSNTEKVTLNVTYDLMTKLNAIESCSISISERGDGTEEAREGVSRLGIKEKGEEGELEKQESFDPFSEDLIGRFLEAVDFPGENHSKGYYLLHDTVLVSPKVGAVISLGAHDFEVKKLLGEGAYARIFRLINTNSGEPMIGKFQKPAFPWEFYIAREVQSRIRDSDMVAYFMDIESGYFFRNSSMLLSRPVEFGDLLAVINKMKQAKLMCHSLAMYFTCQILKIIETLHSCKIIHGDIKPDNFLLRNHNNKLQLQLIDFGRSIDMSLFPEGTTFTRVVTTEGFTTVEMRLNKPWTYQIDYYGVANCGHCLLFGDYMKVVEKEGAWNIAKVMPRYWARTEWKNFFVNLINVKSCSELPDLSELRQSFEAVLEESSEFEFNLFKLQNLLNDR